MTDLEAFLSDEFHSCALVAFVEQAKEQQGWPDMEKTKQRAYKLYECRNEDCL
jgi:hypothetical protein